jgi:hypothetical protein
MAVRKPHQVNPSGISRKDCGCPACHQDRTLLDCKHPGQCIETAKMLINSILPKWNPTMPNFDLCKELALTAEEREQNEKPIECDQVMVFDPNFALLNIPAGFRIFAFEDSLNEIPARRHKMPELTPDLRNTEKQCSHAALTVGQPSEIGSPKCYSSMKDAREMKDHDERRKTWLGNERS